jgi:hypothetical protein
MIAIVSHTDSAQLAQQFLDIPLFFLSDTGILPACIKSLHDHPAQASGGDDLAEEHQSIGSGLVAAEDDMVEHGCLIRREHGAQVCGHRKFR